jgi:hypothetical protein
MTKTFRVWFKDGTAVLVNGNGQVDAKVKAMVIYKKNTGWNMAEQGYPIKEIERL